MNFFIMMFTVGIVFYGYASDQVCAIDVLEKSVVSFPTIDDLKTKKAVLNYKIADVGEFNIDCSSGSVILRMSSFAHLNIRLVSADPTDQQKQIVYAILLTAMRSGETSKYYADGPVADLEKLQSGVQFNLNVQNDTYNNGMPRFWIQFLKSENNNWVDVGFVRLGHGFKDRLSDEGVPHAISQNEALKTIAQKGHPMPGVGGLAEPAILIHKDYQGRGIGSVCIQLIQQLALPVYRQMNMPFGEGSPLNWVFFTASKENPMVQKLMAKVNGVMSLGEFSSVYGDVKKQYFLFSVKDENLTCEHHETDSKTTYQIVKK